MSSLTVRTPSVKPSRPKPSLSFRLPLPIGSQDGEFGVIEIVETTVTRSGPRSVTYSYLVQRLDSDWGVAFELRKMGLGHFGDEDENVYHVLLANPQDQSCSCKGWQRWNHCKHHSAVSELHRKGVL